MRKTLDEKKCFEKEQRSEGCCDSDKLKTEHLLDLAVWKGIGKEGPQDGGDRDEKKIQVGEVAKW